MSIREMMTEARRIRGGMGSTRQTIVLSLVLLLAIFGTDFRTFAQVHGAPTTPGPAGMPTTHPANAPGRSTLNPPNAPGRSSVNPPGPAGLPATTQPNGQPINTPTVPTNTTTNAPGMPANVTTNAPGLP